ncbi:hypothetical protein Clacol_010317 [Clathrus columnatus]|uniref:Uncharacterized protein n=1 Tax=Clathrus columnatus TaxID=1419009 RepID=A0AAV5AR97_9AGAM|nr:hypothetical protein Clacol_010317 [Clathrus columnatus]
MLEGLFLKEGGRICTLQLQAQADIIEPMFKNKSFPSLRRVLYYPSHGSVRGAVLGLLSLFSASDHLDALNCQSRFFSIDVLNQLEPVFTHISELTLHIDSTDILQSVLDMLHNNVELRSLTFITYMYNSTPTSRHQTILPGLQCLSIPNTSLLEYLQVPKLTTLNVGSRSLVTIDNPIHQKFDLSSIGYLQVGRWHGIQNILGLTEPIYPQSGFKDACDEINFMQEVNDIFHKNDICDPQPPSHFHLFFDIASSPTLCIQTLQEGFLSRFTGLLELCIGADIVSKEFCFKKILSQVPLLEKLIVPYGGSVTDFFHFFTRFCADPSLCPRLSYISYSTPYPFPTKELQNIAEDFGETLTTWVLLRQQTHGNVLKYITLRNCLPIPDNWLRELQKLGTTVVTVENIEGITKS